MSRPDRQRPPIRVVATDPESEARARALVERLGPRVRSDAGPALELRVGREGLALGFAGDARRAPVVARFDVATRSGPNPLVRALGLDRGVREIVDATAGLGRDAAVLASHGARVTMVERDPVLHALLEDGLERSPNAALRLVAGEAVEVLGSMQGVEAVYLDPMFPETGKAALPRNDAQVLRGLLGDGTIDDERDRELLGAARAVATRRVVVKRGPRAPFFGTQRPDHVVTGTRVRFDVYLPRPRQQSETNPPRS